MTKHAIPPGTLMRTCAHCGQERPWYSIDQYPDGKLYCVHGDPKCWVAAGRPMLPTGPTGTAKPCGACGGTGVVPA